jgi:hypothetical protein
VLRLFNIAIEWPSLTERGFTLVKNHPVGQQPASWPMRLLHYSEASNVLDLAADLQADATDDDRIAEINDLWDSYFPPVPPKPTSTERLCAKYSGGDAECPGG